MKKFKWSLLALLVIIQMFFVPSMNVSAQSGEKNFRIGWAAEPESLSPFITVEVAAQEVFLLIYDPLVSFDKNLKATPKIAESWEVSKDGLTWTFHLKDGITFHDGKKLTSADVKYTYDTILKSKLGLYYDFLTGIKNIETPDELTVVMKTEKPKANMLQITVPILPKHIWEKVKFNDLATYPDKNPIGSGAFQFVEWKKGEYLKLKKNENYAFGAPKVDNIIFTKYANADTLVQSFKLGETDAAIGFNPNATKQLKEDKKFEVATSPEQGFVSLGFNVWKDGKSKGNPLLRNKEIRQAIDYALDKKKYIDMAYLGEAVPGTTIVPPTNELFHYEPSESEVRKYNKEKAKEILRTAGFQDTNGDGILENKDKKPLEFKLFLRTENPLQIKMGQLIQSDLKDIGIKVVTQTGDDGVLGDKLVAGDYDMFIWGWSTDVDPTTILNVVTTDQIGSLSETFYSNPKYDELFYKQATLIDEKERQETVYEMQKILYDDLPYIVLLYENDRQAVRADKWTGFEKVNGRYFFNLTNVGYTNIDLKNDNKVGSSDTITITIKKTTLMWVLGGIFLITLVTIMMKVKKRKGEPIDNFDEV